MAKALLSSFFLFFLYFFLRCCAVTLPDYQKWNYTEAVLTEEDDDSSSTPNCGPLAVAWPKEACDIPIAVADLRVANVTEIPLILNDTFSMVTLIKGKVDELSKMKGGTEVQSFVLTLGLLFVEVTVPTQAPRAKLTVLAAGTALAVFANRLSWWGGRGLMKLDLWVGELPQATILAGAVPYLWDGVPPDEGVAAPIGTEKLKRYARDLGFQH